MDAKTRDGFPEEKRQQVKIHNNDWSYIQGRGAVVGGWIIYGPNRFQDQFFSANQLRASWMNSYIQVAD